MIWPGSEAAVSGQCLRRVWPACARSQLLHAPGDKILELTFHSRVNRRFDVAFQHLPAALSGSLYGIFGPFGQPLIVRLAKTHIGNEVRFTVVAKGVGRFQEVPSGPDLGNTSPKQAYRQKPRAACTKRCTMPRSSRSMTN